MAKAFSPARRAEHEEPIERDYRCNVNGCCLPGTMTDTTAPGMDSRWLCRFHHAVDHREWVKLTARINNRRQVFAEIRQVEQFPFDPHGPILGIERDEGEKVFAWLHRVKGRLHAEIMDKAQAKPEAPDPDRMAQIRGALKKHFGELGQ